MERTFVPSTPQKYPVTVEDVVTNDASSSGISWGAVIAGSVVAAALSLILLALGAGLGLSAVSPWSSMGASAATIGKGAILWLILMQIMASSMGGYLAGRLRTKWQRIHTDEVYFRDTAHGFLAWSVSVVITAAFLTSAAASMAGGAALRGAAGSAYNNSTPNVAPDEYFIDMMLRGTSATPGESDLSLRHEVELIVANGLRQGAIPEGDRAYLAQVVATRTGMTEPDAEKRVSDAFLADQHAADAIRKATAHSL